MGATKGTKKGASADTSKTGAKRAATQVLAKNTGPAVQRRHTRRAVHAQRGDTPVENDQPAATPSPPAPLVDTEGDESVIDPRFRSGTTTAASHPDPSQALEKARQDNEALQRQVDLLRGLIASQRPLPSIPQPKLPNNSLERLATFDRVVGLNKVSGDGMEALNDIRKKMVSWFWDTIHDTVFFAKVEQEIPRYATYDELSKGQADELVAKIMDKIRSQGVLRRALFKGDREDIPRFDIHWPVREVLKTVLTNEKKASARIGPGGDAIRKMFDQLSADDKARLFAEPQLTVNKAPKVEGAGRGRPRNATSATPSSASSPAPDAPSSLIRSHILRRNASPTPLRQYQESTPHSPHDSHEILQSSTLNESHYDPQDPAWDNPDEEEDERGILFDEEDDDLGLR